MGSDSNHQVRRKWSGDASKKVQLFKVGGSRIIGTAVKDPSSLIRKIPLLPFRHRKPGTTQGTVLEIRGDDVKDFLHRYSVALSSTFTFGVYHMPS